MSLCSFESSPAQARNVLCTANSRVFVWENHESSAIDAGLKRLIGHKIFFFWQSQASIRMSRGTGSLRVASEGLSCPFLKTFAVVFFWPTALWRQKWGDEWDIKGCDECIKWHEVYQIASSRCNNSTSTRFAEVQFKLLSRRIIDHWILN